LAVADKECIGKTLKHGKIEFEVKESFYKGTELGENELKQLLREHDNINLVGKKAVGVALSENLISEASIIRISGVPHVQIFKI